MSPSALLAWVEDRSDWLSPLVVKEVRQVVRGREFVLSMAVSLLASLAVAFYGAAEALGGRTSTGSWTFAALMICLALLGLGVVPLAAFNALRRERTEQTLDLITLTALTARRIVVGKLLAQVVKLAVLFAAMAPFVAMSFLLGGIDLLTILEALVLLFMSSVWAAASCLFLSTAFKSRVLSVVVFGVVGAAALLMVLAARTLILFWTSGGVPAGVLPFGSRGPSMWTLAVMSSFWLVSLVNLILLTEHRLAPPSQDSVTPVRLGFLALLLLIAGWAFVYRHDAAPPRALDLLMHDGGIYLAATAAFLLTEDLALPRRLRARVRAPSRWRWWIAAFGPGGGRAAAFLLAEMAFFVAAVRLFHPSPFDLHWTLAACGYIAFFGAVPTAIFWRVAPSRATPVRLRVTLLVTVAASTLLPDILYYVLWRPETLDLSYGARHLVNPFRTLSNWDAVERGHWFVVPAVLGVAGVVACLTLFREGARLTAPGVDRVVAGD